MVYEITWFKNKGKESAKHLVATCNEKIVDTTMENSSFLGKRYIDLAYWLEGKRASIKMKSTNITFR